MNVVCKVEYWVLIYQVETDKIFVGEDAFTWQILKHEQDFNWAEREISRSCQIDGLRVS